MAEDRILDLCRIDIFTAGDDHVLDPVLDVEIAIFIHHRRVAGVEPAIGVDRLCGFLRIVKIMQHVEAGSCGDFSDRAVRDFLPFFVDDLQLDTGQWNTDAAHPFVAIGVMILRR